MESCLYSPPRVHNPVDKEGTYYWIPGLIIILCTVHIIFHSSGIPGMPYVYYRYDMLCCQQYTAVPWSSHPNFKRNVN